MALQYEKLAANIYVVTGESGTDYVRVCRAHRWASWPAHDLSLVLPCPECRAELDARSGHARFDAVEASLFDQERATEGMR